MPKAFSEQEKETIRAQMREKGKKLFERHGLKKTSVDELTEAVRISKGAFYLFYESKEELFLEILEQIEDEIQTAILEFAIHPAANARTNISTMLRSFLLTWDAYPLLKNFSKSDFDYLARKVSSERILQHAKSDEEFTKQFINKIKREGIAVKASPRIIGNLIKSLFFMSLHRDDLGEKAYDESMNVMIDLVAGYIVGE
ncbi:MAG: TetR/AcrR family transcriptional regulator [Anaerolineales bacterium]|nr:TetR/AcrR family transcriptional regulator [Anaerolineales bacterium]